MANSLVRSHPLTGSWRLAWSQSNRHKLHDLHMITNGLLPHTQVELVGIRQEISIERGTWLDIADVVFFGGYEATWAVHGYIDTCLPRSCPIAVNVHMHAAHLVGRHGTPNDWLRPFLSRGVFDLGSSYEAYAETIFIGTESRVDRDNTGKLAVLRRNV